MADRLEVIKTYKLFIDGKFPRSESGRTIDLCRATSAKPASARRPRKSDEPTVLAHVCRASRKDLRDAVSAARRALPGWSGATAYLRGQILYRMAEMLEGKREEFVRALETGETARTASRTRAGAKASPAAEVQCVVDRLVCFAGWSDKFAQVLGCNNPVAGPYYNFTVPEPVGVVAVLAPDEPGLLGLVSLIAPALSAGNTVVAVAGANAAASLAGVLFAEVAATSDVPPGVLNLLTGERGELTGVVASHRDIDAVLAGGVDSESEAAIRAGVAENLKRVSIRGERGAQWFDAPRCQSPWWIEPLVNMKTMWHPAAT
ncbi:MAG: aldehyde dehydrogenase family protein [Phycisphaerales bacterium]